MQGNPQETLLAYIAGIIDGEGTIFICKSKSPEMMKKQKLLNPRYVGGVSVSMTCRAPLQLIYDVTGFGYVAALGVRSGREFHKPFFQWKCAAKSEGIPFLQMIRKYLLVKDKQADLLMKFYEDLKIPFNKSYGLDPDELQRREDAYQKMRKLNRVGVLATTESTGAERPSDSLNCMETCRERSEEVAPLCIKSC